MKGVAYGMMEKFHTTQRIIFVLNANLPETHRFSVTMYTRFGFSILADGNIIGDILFQENHWSQYSAPCFRVHQGGRNIKPAEATVFADGIKYAMNLLSHVNATYEEKNADRLAAYRRQEEQREAERQERAERQARERETYMKQKELETKAISEFVEQLKWHVGDRMKLTRIGKRSTVFGTIDSISNNGYYMEITTEKSKPMTIYLRDITELWLKDEDGGRGKYDSIYTKAAINVNQ